MDIWPKNVFSAERSLFRNSGRDKARCHFLVAWTVPPNFVYHGPKSRVLILMIGHWPKMAKILDEPRKMTHTSEAEICMGLEKNFW